MIGELDDDDIASVINFTRKNYHAAYWAWKMAGRHAHNYYTYCNLAPSQAHSQLFIAAC